MAQYCLVSCSTPAADSNEPSNRKQNTTIRTCFLDGVGDGYSDKGDVMAHWEKEPLHKVKYKRFTFYYDTAAELGRMAFESGSKMPNPYDPINSEYDEYDEAYIKAQDDYVNAMTH